MSPDVSFDPVWEDLYGSGVDVRYPYDQVVSFVFRHRPRHTPHEHVRILEVGCGTGNNLWFAAREGFRVFGVDASPTAIRTARERFRRENLDGRFVVANFESLPFHDGSFDMVLDRAAITCCGLSHGRRCIDEIRRVLAKEGVFFFNPYSDAHGSRPAGVHLGDGLVSGFPHGPFARCGQICFYGREDVDAAFSRGWSILSMLHMEAREMIGPDPLLHTEWRVAARREELP